MSPGRAWLALALLAGGCFTPDLGKTPFACGDGTPPCPAGYTCGADRLCHQQPPSGSADAAIRCTAATKTCVGDLLVDCTGDQPVITDCKVGCDSASARCRVLVPSNVAASCVPAGQPASLVISGDTRWDTDNCVQLGGLPINQGNGAPDLCAVRLADFTLPKDAVLTVRGRRAMVIVALERMAIGGTIDVAGRGSLAGPGASAESSLGRGASSSPNTSEGGGGGGHAVAGGAGGTIEHSKVVHPCGPAIGSAALTPLTAGGYGGFGGAPCVTDPCASGKGGGGGGGLQLVACRELVIAPTAVIDASGGGGAGGSGTMGDLIAPGGGDGGGAGGGILIEAPAVSVPAGAAIVANGGGGGGGGARGDFVNASGKPGEDGAVAERPAAGGRGFSETSGNGGRGGASGSPDGGGKGTLGGAGGGGGSAGRIRVNTRADRPADLAGSATLSPQPSLGSIARDP